MHYGDWNVLRELQKEGRTSMSNMFYSKVICCSLRKLPTVSMPATVTYHYMRVTFNRYPVSTYPYSKHHIKVSKTRKQYLNLIFVSFPNTGKPKAITKCKK